MSVERRWQNEHNSGEEDGSVVDEGGGAGARVVFGLVWFGR